MNRSSLLVFTLSLILSLAAIIFSYQKNYLLTYGDAESHLNIAKRVVGGLQPGLTQLGGVWLPLPHLAMAPLTASDFLWRTGLAGSIVSGVAFVVASVAVFKLGEEIIGRPFLSFLAALAFMTNPNLLYLQSIAMGEMLFIMLLTLNALFLARYFQGKGAEALVLAGVFAFWASLTRYDGWFLIILEMLLLGVFVIKKRSSAFSPFGLGLFILLSLSGIFLWLGWNEYLFHDPFFFGRSAFSAQVQQELWISRGVLLTKGNPVYSLSYYTGAVADNLGGLIFAASLVGLVSYLWPRDEEDGSPRLLIIALLFGPFFFNVLSLFLGQSVLFVPLVVPDWSPWKLFNVRYGALMIPALAVFFGYLFKPFWPKHKEAVKTVGLGLVFGQLFLAAIGFWPINTLEEGLRGISRVPTTQVEGWMRQNYRGGLVLVDEFSRSLSVIKSGLPIESIVYVGVMPLWEQALLNPAEYVEWIVVREGDALWQNFFENNEGKERLTSRFDKVFEDEKTQVFRKKS